jgi:lipopolysaccharide export LptBFGC system permease protein LptF
MLQNKIYQNYTIEIFRTFLTILFSLSIIAWTVRAVNFLDLIVESGYPISTYFQYSILNLFGILTKFIPLSFLIALTIFIVKQIEENELVILWTSGVKKIQLVHLFFSLSLFVAIFYMLFSIFITPFALNKSRLLLGNDNVTSFLPTIKVQQFNDSFNGLTFIVDDKTENRIKNIFLQDTSNVLKSITTNEAKNSTTTIIAGDGLIEGKKMILFNGKIITSNQEDKENDIIKFEQLSFDLNNIQSTTIKQPKIQETSTISLIDCYKENKIKNSYCKKNYKEEILPVLNRRIILPFFIPVIALLSSLLLIKTKKNIFLNKISIFFYCFLILLYAELIIRYTGLSNVVNNFFLISPIIFSIISYIFLKFKFSKELNTK